MWQKEYLVKNNTSWTIHNCTVMGQNLYSSIVLLDWLHYLPNKILYNQLQKTWNHTDRSWLLQFVKSQRKEKGKRCWEKYEWGKTRWTDRGKKTNTASNIFKHIESLWGSNLGVMEKHLIKITAARGMTSTTAGKGRKQKDRQMCKTTT